HRLRALPLLQRARMAPLRPFEIAEQPQGRRFGGAIARLPAAGTRTLQLPPSALGIAVGEQALRVGEHRFEIDRRSVPLAGKTQLLDSLRSHRLPPQEGTAARRPGDMRRWYRKKTSELRQLCDVRDAVRSHTICARRQRSIAALTNSCLGS